MVYDRRLGKLIVLDIIMPGIDGLECCAMIRKYPDFQTLPILIQTAVVDPDIRIKAFEKGATDLVSKPIYPEELCARIIVHLEKHYALDALQLYKERIEQELETARQLQLGILPTSEEVTHIQRSSNLDIASYFQPSSEIGGDFWGCKSLSPHQVALWLVDFSGHGVASALNAFRLQAYIREYSALSQQPGEYLSHLNDKLINLLLRGQFATMFYGIIDTSLHQLSYACACAPHPILYRQDGSIEALDGSGIPLGIQGQSYPTQSTPFHSGDVLVLYSDALIETPDAKGHCLDKTSLMEELQTMQKALGASAIKDLFLEYFNHHAIPPSDDLTLTICKRQ